jgi:uncharacterized protein (DUF608 family)
VECSCEWLDNYSPRRSSVLNDLYVQPSMHSKWMKEWGKFKGCECFFNRNIGGIILRRVIYVPLCVIVLFCVLFVCGCVLDNCHRDIGALFDYPN